MNTSAQIATTILNQLGGRQFVVMTGAKNMTHGNNSLYLRFPGVKAANHLTVELNGSDLYNVTFTKIHGSSVKVVKQYSDIYAEDLRGLFERFTGLRTSLTHVFA